MDKKSFLPEDAIEAEIDGNLDPRELLYRLGETPLLMPSRNDPCYCQSGKKYKKCCLQNDNVFSKPPKIRKESMTISYNSLTSEECRNDFDKPSDEDRELLAQLHHQMHHHQQTIESEESEYFQHLYRLRSKYPNYPVILNYLTNGYKILGNKKKIIELIMETYTQFPSYLFGCVARAELYLKEDRPEKALETLKNAYTLIQFHPERTVFHISEFCVFSHFMVRYFCYIKEVKRAEIYFQTLEQILDSDDPYLIDAQDLLIKSRGLHNLFVRFNRLIN